MMGYTMFPPFFGLFFLALIIPFWKIFPRADWPAPMALLMVIPLVNLVMLYVLAFKKWPGDQS